MTVTTRRQRREQERRKDQRRSSRTKSPRGPRRGSGLIVGAAVLGAVALGVFLLSRVISIEPPPQVTKPDDIAPPAQGVKVGTQMPDLGSEHVDPGRSLPLSEYNSVPPTSGKHWNPASPWGVMDRTVPHERFVHNHEHGGVTISYNGLDADERTKLIAFARQLMGAQYPKLIVHPYPQLTDAKIALTSWRWIHKLQTVDEAQILNFIRQHYSDPSEAPEANVR